ncbi:MAG: vitamin K epoxide reductase family protein [Phycisphaeraceae bacterium]
MSEADSHELQADAPRSLALLGLVALGAAAALAIAGYLSVQSLTGGAVAGCGGEAGCGAVLASPWSRAGPVPVSVLGALVYLGVLVGVGLRWRAQAQGRSSKLGDALLIAAAPALLVAAGWFTYIQFAVVGDICAYCMAEHGLGVALALLIRADVVAKPAVRPGPFIALGVTAVAGLIAVQQFAPSLDVQTTENFFVDRDGDTTTPDGDRHVSMFGGDLQFVLQDTPHLGDPQAEQVVGLVFDYGCLHCRALHKLLEEGIKQDPRRFVVVPLPITLQPKHNPYAQSDNAAFDDSHERATLALAVAAIDRGKWERFDRWLWSPASPTGFPRSAEDARAKAVELVGEDALQAQLTGDAIEQHRATVNRNIGLLRHLDPPRTVPIVTTPGAPRHLTERFYDLAVLDALLDEAAERLQQVEQADRANTDPA